MPISGQSRFRRVCLCWHLSWSAPSVVEVDVLLSQHPPADAAGQHVVQKAVQLQFLANKRLGIALTQSRS